MKLKKLISVILAVLTIFSVCQVAVYAEGYVQLTDKSKTPIIHIRGDGDPIYDKDGNKLLDLSNMSDPDNATDSETSQDALMESIANVLMPFLIEGLLSDKWDNYYANLQKEIGELFGDILLDKDGNVTNGSGISQERYKTMNYDMTHNNHSGGYYYDGAYHFWYDWRCDPVEIADDFNDYIKAVKKVTGKKKVAIMAKCLGSNVVLAYVAKYGMNDICGVGIDGSVTNGAEIMSEMISGKFVLDGDALTRFLIDCDAFGLKIDTLITSTIDLLSRANVFDSISTATKETIYYRVVQGVTSALALSTAFTWPSYWAGVTAEDYETAKEYVFGPEGSEKRTEYAGLIAKLDNYDKLVRQNLTSLMNQINDNANLCIISKYGMQMFPCVESRNNLGDQFASVTRSSFGATTSTIYGTLSEDYIASVTESGKGKYISPDKQVDASTCLFPDRTWFVKGASHTNWTKVENRLLLTVATADRQLTVDDFELSQFMVYDNETNTMSKMTTENCDCYNWTANESADGDFSEGNFFSKILAFLNSLVTWIREIFTRFFNKD